MTANELQQLLTIPPGDRHRLLFGHKPLPPTTMTLTKSQRSDIHRAAVEFNQTYLATFSQKVHFIIDLCEMRRQPSHLEEVNQALGLEIERLRDEIDHLRDELIAAQTTKD